MTYFKSTNFICSVIVLLLQDLALASDEFSQLNPLSSKKDPFLFQEIPSVDSAPGYVLKNKPD